MRRRVEAHREIPDLIEVVMDLGRCPLARFPSGDLALSDHPISSHDLHHCAFQEELEFELMAENLLTRLLREKLCSKELELEQLQEDYASSIRTHDILQTEIQRLQDELSCLTHKAKDMELQDTSWVL